MSVLVVVGTYGRKVYGIEFSFKEEEKNIFLDSKNIFSTLVHTSTLTSIALNKERSILVTGGKDEVVNIFDLKKKRHKGVLSHHVGTISSLCFFKQYLFVCSEDGTISITRTSDWEHVHTLIGHKEGTDSFSVHPNGKVGISIGGRKKRSLKAWNLLSAKLLSTSILDETQHGKAISILWSKTGERYSILFDRGIEVYKLEKKEKIFEYKSKNQLKCQLFYEDTHVLCGDEAGSIISLRLEDGEVVSCLNSHETRIKEILCISFEKMNILFTVSTDGLIRAWKLESILVGEDAFLYEHKTNQRIINAA